MSPHDTALEQNEYKLVLVKSGLHAIWAERRGHDLCLPRISIPRWTRPAEQLQEGTKAAWHLRTIVLDFLPVRKDSLPLVVAEIISSELPYGLTAASIGELSDAELDVEERSVVKDILAGNQGARGPLSRLGWIQEAKEWLCTEVGRTDALTGDICQFNASGTFALVRFGTREVPAYWLKATGPPNENEFEITLALAHCFPHFLPPIIGARKDWNAWVMEDGGISLRNDSSPAAMERAVTALATFQIQSISRIEVLQNAGCHDQRLTHVLEHLDPMIGYLEEAMGHQVSSKVPRLDSARLRRLAEYLRCACEQMLELEVPDTLVHGDINTGNVLFKGEKCVFIDWAEAYLGNPLLVFEHLTAHLRRQIPDSGPRIAHISKLYRAKWLEVLSESQIDRGLSLAPVLALATCLIGRGDWLKSTRSCNSEFQGYARSLARKMYSIVNQRGALEAAC
jgi:hypothetical protein